MQVKKLTSITFTMDDLIVHPLCNPDLITKMTLIVTPTFCKNLLKHNFKKRPFRGNVLLQIGDELSSVVLRIRNDEVFYTFKTASYPGIEIQTEWVVREEAFNAMMQSLQ